MSLIKAKQFIGRFHTCVLATVTKDGLPQSATVGLSCDDNFSILIGTNKSTRKYKNLKNNSKVSLVVGFDGSATLQYEGNATELLAADSKQKLAQHHKKNPGAIKFAEQPGQVYFLIRPSWVRFTDYASKNPIFETTEFKL